MSEKTVVRAWSFIVHSRVKLSAGLLLVAFILKVVMGRFYGSFDKGEECYRSIFKNQRRRSIISFSHTILKLFIIYVF